MTRRESPVLKPLLKALTPGFAMRVYHRRKLAREAARNATRSAEEVFAEIYRDKKWGGDGAFCSGAGSASGSIVGPYVETVRAFLRSGPAKLTVIDLGCGDFSVGSQLVADCAGYVGVDVVPDLVRHLQGQAPANARFACLDITRDELPAGDVCLVRQVLQHLSNAQIGAVLAKLGRYRTAFVTEHHPQDGPAVVPNRDKVHGSGIRLFEDSGVYLDRPPFNVPSAAIELVLEVPDHGFGSHYKPGVIRTYKLTFPDRHDDVSVPSGA